MGTFLFDLRQARRLLIRDRGYSIAAAVTLAVVIAANVAVFSVLNSVVLRPLPFDRAEDLVWVFNSYPKAGVERASNSAPDFFDRRQGVPAFEEVAALRDRDYTLGAGTAPIRVAGLQVTPSFFPLLRADAWLGRTFTEEEGEVGNDRRVVLSHSLWMELFGGDRGAVGRELRLDGVAHQVVGVMPADFRFIDPGLRLWTPQAFTPEQRQQYHDNDWSMLGRLAHGATIDQARAQLDALNARQIERAPELREVLFNAGYHTRAEPFQEDLVRTARRTLFLLWAGVLFVLLIGCVNVANLALVRASGRFKELAMRVTLGASRLRVARQLVTESVLLTLVGAVAGLGLGWAGLRALLALGIDRLPRGAEVGIDATVVFATLAVAAVIGVGLGLIPALQVRRAATATILREEGRTTTVGRRARLVRRGLVAIQVATAFMLLVGAALLFTSFRNILAVHTGLDPEGVLTASLVLPDSTYPDAASQRAFASRTLEAIRALPGVEAAALTSTIPFGGSYSDSVILAEGYQMQPGESVVSPNRVVAAPGFFEALGIRLVAGRFFDERDGADAPRAVIVDERLARRFWPGQSPVGKRMFRPSSARDLTGAAERTDWLTVVGVVGEVRLQDLEDTDRRLGVYFFPLDQSPRSALGVVVKAAGEPALLAGPVRRALARVDPELPLFDLAALSDRISSSVAARRSAAALTAVSASLALFLAAIGLYGVLAYVASQRLREIGIRMALGSTPARVFQLIAGEGVGIVVSGLAAGLGLAVLLRGFMRGHLFGVGPLEPWALAATAAMLAVVAVGASSVPALRAARVQPSVVLHE